ncbi:MAG: pilus assembly protein PilZ [Treponema sp.]|nr:pilus assembly protein PilZ [Treponema sp.]
MAENDNSAFFGKKIFFLHPPVSLQNHVIAELAQEEFEIYIAKDEAKLRKVLKKYPDSVVFAFINEKLRENVWDEWVRSIISVPETAAVNIGIIASAADENLRNKYINQYKVRCGFTVLKADSMDAVKQLVDILNGINAKGRRKYIRAITNNESNTTVNFPMNGTFVNGLIKDISAVGFSCSFTEDPEFTRNKLFTDIQIRLQSQLVKVEGVVFGSRIESDEKIYVILFTQRIDPEVRTKIRKYIQTNLQNKMDTELK